MLPKKRRNKQTKRKGTSDVSDRISAQSAASKGKQPAQTSSAVHRPPASAGRALPGDSVVVLRPTVDPIEPKAGPIGKTKRASAAVKPTLLRTNVESASPGINLASLRNPQVRAEAAKLAARLDKFREGFEIANNGAYRLLSAVNVEAEIGRLIALADANSDPAMLRQFLDVSSFRGKLSPFQPTTEEGRAQVRLAQLFYAVQGDGTYKTVRANIARLVSDAEGLRAMARDAALLSTIEGNPYVDDTRLLRPADGAPAQKIDPHLREWYIEQASLMQAYRDLGGASPALQKKLAQAMLQSYTKAAPLQGEDAARLGAQTSPLLAKMQMTDYYRSGINNPLLAAVREAYEKDMSFPEHGAHLVDNASFHEVLARDYALSGVNTKIGSIDEYTQALDALFKQVEHGQFPQRNVVFDITDLFALARLQPNEITGLTASLEQTLLDKAETFLTKRPDIDQQKFANMLQKLWVGAITTHRGVSVLLTPRFLSRAPAAGDSPLVRRLLEQASVDQATTYPKFVEAVETSMSHSGYRLDPFQARRAWLEVADPAAILSKYGIQFTQLATSERSAPRVFENAGDMLAQQAFRDFESLASNPKLAPYVRLLSQGTANLLRGLTKVNPAAGGIDQAMRDQGLDQVLQIAYFRIINAMATASLQQDNMVAFMNQIEVIQQQLATILTLAEPHGEHVFGDSITARLVDPAGPNDRSVIPPDLGPGVGTSVTAKPSSMNCLASILGGVEALKGSNALNVAVLKDHYFEAAGTIATSGTYSVSQLDGDAVRAFSGISARPQDANSLKGKMPLDVYVCDFHHNISLDRNSYGREDLITQVDKLYEQGLVAKRFTVAIDCTIDKLQSSDVQAFLEHTKQRITDGELNVVLFRSAQKFDMLGMDNYYGGYAVSINNQSLFAGFNQRMEAPDDQLKGPSRQGLTHLAAHAAQDVEAYRQALMDSTRRFYNALPPGMIWSAGSTSAMQVARTEDPNAVFLDIKFPDNPMAALAFYDQLKAFTAKHDLPLTERPSFGFATTNLTLVAGSKFRLNPGLEARAKQDLYIGFFVAAYQRANSAVQTGTKRGLSGKALNDFVAKQIKAMPI
jgi:hypothetical protein